MIKISATIVVYKEDENLLSKTIEDFLAIDLEKELVIIDNSPDDRLRQFTQKYSGAKYIFSGKNIGFGAGHNLGFSSLDVESDFHLVLNPDISFDASDMKEFTLWMNSNPDMSLAVPQVYYPDKNLQETIRKIPTPMTLIKRRLKIDDASDEFIGVEFKEVTEIPFAHGCFFILPSKIYKQLSGFDERFFIYMEDIDICIRAKKFGKVVINPNYKIYHEYAKGSSKSIKLLFLHIIAAIKFFMKIYFNR